MPVAFSDSIELEKPWVQTKGTPAPLVWTSVRPERSSISRSMAAIVRWPHGRTADPRAPPEPGRDRPPAAPAGRDRAGHALLPGPPVVRGRLDPHPRTAQRRRAPRDRLTRPGPRAGRAEPAAPLLPGREHRGVPAGARVRGAGAA